MEKAVSERRGKARFYAAPNPHHVSHSLVNFQNGYTDTTPFIEVETLSYDELVALFPTSDLQILKLDIEGAEVQVIPHVMRSQTRPKQILVEFDELGWPSRRARTNFYRSHALLSNAGYRVAYHSPPSDFLYAHASLYA